MGLVEEKSNRFALRIVSAYQYLCNEKREYILSKQLLKSGTSIGANLAEAHYAISRNDFLSKAYISLKETAETIYWLNLLHQSGYLPTNGYQSLISDAEELQKMLSSITKTIKETPPNNS